jgi:hypothetical protein
LDSASIAEVLFRYRWQILILDSQADPQVNLFYEAESGSTHTFALLVRKDGLLLTVFLFKTEGGKK